MNKNTGIAIVVAGIALIGGIYYFTQFLPEQNRKFQYDMEQQKESEARRMENERIRNYSNCVSVAEKQYSDSWINDCVQRGIRVMKSASGENTCFLPSFAGETWNTIRKEEINNCIAIYGKK